MAYRKFHQEDNLHVTVESLATDLMTASDGFDVLATIFLADVSQFLKGDRELVELLTRRSFECDCAFSFCLTRADSSSEGVLCEC